MVHILFLVRWRRCMVFNRIKWVLSVLLYLSARAGILAINLNDINDEGHDQSKSGCVWNAEDLSKILFKDVQSRYIASCAISPSKKLRLGRFPASKFGVSSWHASLNYLHGWFGGPACPRIWVVTPKNGRKTVGNPMVLYLFYIAKAAEFPQIPWGPTQGLWISCHGRCRCGFHLRVVTPRPW